MEEVDRCYFQDLETGFDGACACEHHASFGWVSCGGKHNGTVTVMIVVSLVILSRMDLKLFKVEID